MDFYAKKRHGSAQWATKSQLKRAGLYRKKGVFLGLCPYTGKYLTSNNDSPLVLVGGAGSGKFTTNLAYNNFYDGSMLILDPKGEIGACFKAYQKAVGKEFYSINPYGLHTEAPWNLLQHKVNPFEILKADSPYLVSDCKRIAEMLIPLESTKNFFPKRARQWLSNLLLAYALISEKPTLSGFMELVNMIENNHGEFKALALGLLCTLGNDNIERTCHEIINKRASSSADGEYSGVMSTISMGMEFMEDPQLQILFSGADFSLDVLSQTDPYAVVDIAFPAENMQIHKSALRLIIGVAILFQYRHTANKPFFMIDEAAALGTFEELIKSYSYGRSFYRTLSAWQSLGQMSSLYGKDGMQTFLSSSQAQIFIGVRDLETAKYCSDMLGNQTIEVRNPTYEAKARLARKALIDGLIFHGSDPLRAGLELGHWKNEINNHREKIKRPSLTPDEVLTMPGNKGLAFISGLDIDPIYFNRKPHYKTRKIAKCFSPNPYHV